MKSRILLVDDDYVLGETLKDFFESNGLSVAWAQDGDTGLKLFDSFKPQLVLMDVILPEKDGFEVVSEIRKINTTIPVIFMTGTQIDTPYQVKGYELGAVNYLKKPVIPQVVLAQINNLISRSTAISFKLDQLEITIDNQLIMINNTQVILRDKESKLLLLLLKNQHKVISRNDILQSVWSDSSYNLNNVLDTTISRLKKCLTAFPSIEIVSVYGTGYKLTVKKES